VITGPAFGNNFGRHFGQTSSLLNGPADAQKMQAGGLVVTPSGHRSGMEPALRGLQPSQNLNVRITWPTTVVLFR
jgi:hypothetical protein